VIIPRLGSSRNSQIAPTTTGGIAYEMIMMPRHSGLRATNFCLSARAAASARISWNSVESE
jgi:hypothetical protein